MFPLTILYAFIPVSFTYFRYSSGYSAYVIPCHILVIFFISMCLGKFSVTIKDPCCQKNWEHTFKINLLANSAGILAGPIDKGGDFMKILLPFKRQIGTWGIGGIADTMQ